MPNFCCFLIGSHGDGHRSNTDTPLVAWGAGVRHPKPMSRNNHTDYGIFVDDHVHDMPTPTEWGLGNIERVDVNQADIAPLMVCTLCLFSSDFSLQASLYSLKCPFNICF